MLWLIASLILLQTAIHWLFEPVVSNCSRHGLVWTCSHGYWPSLGFGFLQVVQAAELTVELES